MYVHGAASPLREAGTYHLPQMQTSWYYTGQGRHSAKSLTLEASAGPLPRH